MPKLLSSCGARDPRILPSSDLGVVFRGDANRLRDWICGPLESRCLFFDVRLEKKIESDDCPGRCDDEQNAGRKDICPYADLLFRGSSDYHTIPTISSAIRAWFAA